MLAKLLHLLYDFIVEDLRPFIRESREFIREWRDYIREQRSQGPELPEHLSVQEVADYLGKHRTSLYRGVIPELLQPCGYAGNRPYFRKADVVKLMEEYPPTGKNNHRFGKRSKGGKQP